MLEDSPFKRHRTSTIPSITNPETETQKSAVVSPGAPQNLGLDPECPPPAQTLLFPAGTENGRGAGVASHVASCILSYVLVMFTSLVPLEHHHAPDNLPHAHMSISSYQHV